MKNPPACQRVSTCASRDVRALPGGRISKTLEGITLEHLVLINREKAERALRS